MDTCSQPLHRTTRYSRRLRATSLRPPGPPINRWWLVQVSAAFAVVWSTACCHRAFAQACLEPTACIVFDDFGYESATTGAPIREGSLFGTNRWYTNRDKTQTLRQRAWYWSNWYEPAPDKAGAHIAISQKYSGSASDRYVLISIPAGFRFDERDRDPALRTGMAVETGTWVARVRFGPLPVDRRLQQAFWTISPVAAEGIDTTERIGRTEMDIEWNNWFDGGPAGRSSRIHYTNHGFSSGTQGVDEDQAVACFLVMSTRPPRRENANRCAVYPTAAWCTAMIAYDGGPFVRYAMRCDDIWVRGRPAAVWFGNAAEIAEERGENHLPAWPSQLLAAELGQYFRDERPLTTSHEMLVDWFYYSAVAADASAAALDAVEADVAQLRQSTLSRLNTTNLPTEIDHDGMLPYRVDIRGPAALRPDAAGVFEAHVSTRSTTFRYAWSYRHVSVADAPVPLEAWVPVSRGGPRIAVVMPGDCGVVALELKVVVGDRFSRFSTEATYRVANEGCSD